MSDKSFVTDLRVVLDGGGSEELRARVSERILGELWGIARNPPRNAQAKGSVLKMLLELIHGRPTEKKDRSGKVTYRIEFEDDEKAD